MQRSDPSSGMLGAPRENPVLWLGTAGFDAGELAVLSRHAATAPDPVIWRFSDFADADAWLIHGRRTTLGDGQNVRVAPGVPTERSVRLNLPDVNRPVAFAAPLPDGFDPLCRFSLAAQDSVHATLAQIASWLGQRRTQFALGREIVARGAALRHAVFHLMAHGTLVAVLNLRNGRVGFAPELSASDLVGAGWHRRPPAAADIPPRFMQTTVAQLSWTYVRHSDRQLLPERYLERCIYFRSAPKVPLHWLSDAQLLVLRELHADPGTLAQLRQRTGLPAAQLVKDLGCLYFAAAVTGSPSKAARPVPGKLHGTPTSQPDVVDLMRATEGPALEPDDGRFPPVLARQYATVPAPLMMLRA